MAFAFHGRRLVFGIPAVQKPIANVPDGKLRVRFASDNLARVFVRTADGIRSMLLEDRGDVWFANPELTQCRIDRRPKTRAWLPGANLRRFKTFSFA